MARNVRAISDGFYDGSRRRRGDVFTLLDGHKPGKWMEEIKPVAEQKAAKSVKPAQSKEEDLA